jgi:N-methylhydantoinase A
VQDVSIHEVKQGGADATSARIGVESLYWRELGEEAKTCIYGDDLRPGMVFDGPAIIRFKSTTGLIHPGQRARMDGYGNIRITDLGKG